MELIAGGNVMIRIPDGECLYMDKDDVILSHQHHFDHPTFCLEGALEISLLNAKKVSSNGLLLEAEVEEIFIVRAKDRINFFLVQKGRWHSIRALEDNTRYMCVYAHRYPQALSVDQPGQRVDKPLTKRDDDGTLWVRVDETIVEDSVGWMDAYR